MPLNSIYSVTWCIRILVTCCIRIPITCCIRILVTCCIRILVICCIRILVICLFESSSLVIFEFIINYIHKKSLMKGNRHNFLAACNVASQSSAGFMCRITSPGMSASTAKSSKDTWGLTITLSSPSRKFSEVRLTCRWEAPSRES